MKLKVFWKRTMCLLAAMCMLCSYSDLFTVSAAGKITVESIRSGVTESYDDLAEALAAAENGSIVTIKSSNVKLTDNATINTAIILYNAKRIKFNGFKILFEGNAAIYTSEGDQLKEAWYGAKVDGRTVTWKPESGGYVYFLEVQEPTLEDVEPSIDVEGSGELNNMVIKKDEEAQTKYLYHDFSVDGMTWEALKPLLDIEVPNAEEVKQTVTGTVNGRIVTGSLLNIEAGNPDSKVKVTDTYTYIVLGDVNCNGVIDAADASRIMGHVNGTAPLTGNELLAADADQKDGVTAADAEKICFKYIYRDDYNSPLS